MSVSIRLKKMGKKDQPFYRVVAADTLTKREGKYIENLGWYDPMVEGDNFKINQERADYWLSKGARISNTVKSLLSKNRKKLAAVPAEASEAPAPEVEAPEVKEAPAPAPEAPVKEEAPAVEEASSSETEAPAAS